MKQIQTASEILTKKNILNRISDIPGGVSLQLSNLVAGKVVEEASPITAPDSGKRTICKQAKLLTGSTTTSLKVLSTTNQFKVGNFIGKTVGGIAATITEITTASGIDTIALSTAIEAVNVGDFVYEMSAAATTPADTTLNIAYANDTCSGLTDDATSEDVAGSIYPTTIATVVGTIGASGVGNATVTVTSDLLTSPVAISVAVANNDTATEVAGKMRNALQANASVSNLFDILGDGEKIVLKSKTLAPGGAVLKNVPNVILKSPFVVPSTTQVIYIADAFLRADINAGCVGSEYMSSLKGVIEVEY